LPVVLQTTAEQIYAELRTRIVRNELSPGTPLPLADLASEFGVSTMPVRSALAALQTERLVRQQPHRGATVAPLEVEDLEVIQAVRCGIEGFAARTGSAALTEPDLVEMAMLVHRCSEIAAEGPLDLYLSAQWSMQDICYRASGRPQLVDLINQYRRRAERYIRLAVGGRELQQNLPLHERFFEACRQRDGAKTEAAIRAALDWTVETLRAAIAEREEAMPEARTGAKA
jgi:DNA-binding GntR family transcriptional regulator